MTRSAELTTKLLDGSLTDAEWAELDALVSSHPRAESEHLSLLEVEAELRGLRTGFDLTDRTLAAVRDEQTERTVSSVMDEIAHGPAPAWAAPLAAPPLAHRPRHRWRIGAALFTAAAALLIGLWLGGNTADTPVPDPGDHIVPAAFARLARKTGAVELLTLSGDPIVIEEGSDLPAGFTLRTGGDESLAVVELLHDKTRVEIESDSLVRFAGNAPTDAGKPRMFLAAGQLTAAVTQRPDDRPLVVGTSVTEVFARGGTFVVSSAAPDTARVDIKHGRVELVRAAAPKPVPVGAGGSAVFLAGVDRMDVERTVSIDRTPRRQLAAAGTRDAIFSADGTEVWVATAKAFGRWSTSGTLTEIGFFPRRGDGVAGFTRDKRFLLTCRGDRDDRVLVRTLPDCGEHASINARPGDARMWAVAPDAAWLAVVDAKPSPKRVRVYEGGSGEERFEREFDDLITCVAADPDGTALAVATNATARGAGNKVVLVDALTSDRLLALSVLKKPVTAMTFSADGRFLAVGFNGTVQLWDLRTLELVRTIAGFERALGCLAFAPDGQKLAAGTQDGNVWVWDVTTGRQTQLIESGGRGVRSIAFSPNGKQLVTVANNAPVAVWDVADPVPVIQ
ncbi:FecR domain-containing protein [Frigoriglobus tundricola]|uniref:FecR protein domain-containing protein n=1 Tax=Frigoriglobus tundricola TaxID=2774151 RepID=A0A6M5Z6B6_9BACT|nr:FecR domain-containing protein [Frigoriglobus tundricola]QJX00954.1 hypothetical protein FTUN_8592 [Frigoriglobus tundricola]